jgi:hypothetical protein
MWNQPYQRRGIRFFPHIVPIGFPLIFPIGFGLALGLFHWLFPLIGLLLFVGLAFFIIKTITQGGPDAAWNSMKNMGGQWGRRFTSQSQQPPYNQPSHPAGQGQSPYYQPGANPYYQPSNQAGQEPAQPYGQGYQAGANPYYQPSAQPNEVEQPRAHYPEQTPPMQQQ